MWTSSSIGYLWYTDKHRVLLVSRFFRQNTTPCGVEIFPKTLVAWTFHSNLRVYLCHGNVSNGRTEIPAKVRGRIAIKWLAHLLAMPEKTWVLDTRVLEKHGTRRKTGSRQWTEKSRDGKPIKQVCIGRDGQMFIICLALLMHSCGDCHQHTTLCISPAVPATMREIQNVGCLKAFIYMLAPVLIADCRHWGRPQGVAKGEVSVLSSRYSVAIALYPARPDRVIQQQRTAQRRAVSLEESWGSIGNQV